MAQQTYPTPPSGQFVPPYGAAPHGAGLAPRRRPGVIVAAVAGAVVVLGGLVVGALLLFGPAHLDTAEAERRIAQLTEDQAGVAPTDVSCPEDVVAGAGVVFTCSASLDGQAISFTVTQADDAGAVQIDSDNTFVDVATVEASLDEQWGQLTGVQVVSTCDTGGRAVLVDGVGTAIPCTVTNAEDGTDSLEVSATVDEDGVVSSEVR